MGAFVPAPSHQARQNTPPEADPAKFRRHDDVVKAHIAPLCDAEAPGHVTAIEIEGGEGGLLPDPGDDLGQDRVVGLLASIGLRRLTHPPRRDLRFEDHRRIGRAFL